MSCSWSLRTVLSWSCGSFVLPSTCVIKRVMILRRALTSKSYKRSANGMKLMQKMNCPSVMDDPAPIFDRQQQRENRMHFASKKAWLAAKEFIRSGETRTLLHNGVFKQAEVLEVLHILHKQGSGAGNLLAVLKWSEELALVIHKTILLSKEQTLPRDVRGIINAYRAEISHQRYRMPSSVRRGALPASDKWGIACDPSGKELIGGSTVAMYDFVLRALWLEKQFDGTKHIFQRMLRISGQPCSLSNFAFTSDFTPLRFCTCLFFTEAPSSLSRHFRYKTIIFSPLTRNWQGASKRRNGSASRKLVPATRTKFHCEMNIGTVVQMACCILIPDFGRTI